ncbi:MAG: hypothetical protein ABSB50_12475 [Terracidiphilus sp.]
MANDGTYLSTRRPNIASNPKDRGTQNVSRGLPFSMDHLYSRNIIEILRSTLRRLEQDADFRQDDPAVVQLKRHILQSLAEFELQKASQPRLESRPGIELEKPISVLRIR